MADPYGLEMSGLDPEYVAELRKLSKQEKMAEELAKRGMQPLQGQMVGNTYVRPSIFQGLAGLANSWVAKSESDKVEEGYKSLGERRKAIEEAALERYRSGTMGTPEIPSPPDELGGGPFRAATTPSPDQRRQAIMEAIAMGNPRLSKMATLDLQQDWRKEDKAEATKNRMAELQIKMEDAKLSREERLAAQKELMQMRLDAQKEMKQMAGVMSKTQPYFSPFDSSEGAMVFDHRTGRMVPAVNAAGQPIRKSTSDPTLQGDIAGAKKAGQAKAERAINMAGLGATIKEAEDLLSGASGKALPTGSGVGTLVDAAAGLVGANPSGAAEAQTMKAIGGALTSKMPRMEGPQSDKDTQLYREMAAVVGDSTVPRERRAAALQKVKELWGKYEHLNTGDAKSTTSGAPAFDDAEKERRYQEWKAKQR